MNINLLVCAVSIALAIPLAAQHTEPALVTPASPIVAGKRIFEMNCSVGYCHGLEGRAGKGPRLRDRVWSKSYLYSTVEKGIPNSSMPAWQGRLTSESIDAVVSYVISISHEQPAPAEGENNKLKADPKLATDQNADSGKELFFDLMRDRNCGTCHRIGGSGTPVARDLPDLANRPEESLLRQIEEPPARGEPVQVKLRNGDTVSGIKENAASRTIHLYDLSGDGPPVLRTIDQASIASESPCAGLNVHGSNARSYTTGELLEIVAFLKSVR